MRAFRDGVEFAGLLKCALDRFYSSAYLRKPRNLKKAAMILSSGDSAMYDGAMFSYKGDFLEYLGLVMIVTILIFTLVGSFAASRVPNTTMGSFSVFMTLILGIKFIVKPVMMTKETSAATLKRATGIVLVVLGVVILTVNYLK